MKTYKEFRESVFESLKEKIASRLSEEKQILASSLIGTEKNVNEVKKSTLISYIDKAANTDKLRDAHDDEYSYIDDFCGSPYSCIDGKDGTWKEIERLDKRHKGIKTAAKKLAKGDYQNEDLHDFGPTEEQTTNYSLKKGAFHKWLGKPEGEKITDEDIQRGLDSKDSHVRKMAQFAKNSKNWHKESIDLDESKSSRIAKLHDKKRTLQDRLQKLSSGPDRDEKRLRVIRDEMALIDDRIDLYQSLKEASSQETIDELHKETLASYVKGASYDRKNIGSKQVMDFVINRSLASKKQIELHAKDVKRKKGIALAVDKIVKKDYQNESLETIDEAREKSFHDKVRAHYKEEIDSYEDGSLVGKDKDKNTLVRKGFFYTHGKTSKDHANKVSQRLNDAGIEHEVVDHGEIDKPFRGGSNTKQGSHFWVSLRDKG